MSDLVGADARPRPSQPRPRPDGLRATVYVWSILVGTAVLSVALAAAVARTGADPVLVGAVVLLAVPSAMQVAGTLVFLVLQAVVPPGEPLPELAPGAEDAEVSRTCVVYPAIVHDAADVDALVAAVLECRQGCGDGFAAHVALVDFADAPAPELPSDAELRTSLDAALSAHGALALYRARRWNPAERSWMGWERKRGKLLEFTALVAGAGRGSFTEDPAVLHGLRFVITVDLGDRLLAGGARRLVAAIAHPDNRAVVDQARRTVVTGFAVIRPAHVSDRPRSLFEWAWQPYSDSGGETSFAQQMFGRDLFFGQGIVDVAAFRAALDGRIPENSVLSHDKLEGMYAPTGSIEDAVIVEGSVGDYLAFRQRAHRWTRGDVHLLPWIGRRSLPLLGRWVLLSDLVGHLWPPATLSLLALGWLAAPPGLAGLWTAAVLATYLQGAIVTPIAVLVARSPERPGGLRALASMLGQRVRLGVRLSVVELARAPMWIVLLADSAVVAVDAAARALYRTLVSRRHVLQWTTSARAVRAVSGGGLAERWRHMWVSCALAAALAVPVAVLNPEALPWAAPLLCLWLLAPPVAYWTARPRSGSGPLSPFVD